MDNKVFIDTTSIIKQEVKDDYCVGDNILVCEDIVNINKSKFEEHVRDNNTKPYEICDTVDSIKTELSTLEVCNNSLNTMVKVEDGTSFADIKIKFHDGLFFCEHCCAFYEDYCTKCGMLMQILNSNTLRNAQGIPSNILELRDSFGQTGIFALKDIPGGVKFGPFSGLSSTGISWRLKRGKITVKESRLKYLNWMQFVNPAKNASEQSLLIFEYKNNLYYRSTRKIQEGEELLVYHGEEYEDSIDKDVEIDFIPTVEENCADVFACTLCCFGFSSKVYLMQHKITCPNKINGQFSSEELMQCPFCKIYLDKKEYLEYHVAQCQMSAIRQHILPTPINPTAEITGYTTSHPQVYTHEEYTADIRNHTNHKNYEMNTYTYEISNSRYKTKESPQLLVENARNSVSGKEDQEHSTSDYMNGHIKVEQLNLQVLMKRFKCSLCLFRTKYKQHLQRHIKSKHLEEFLYKCDICEFKTNIKSHIKVHVKTKHLEEFDNKCDLCEFRTNNKNNLTLHIKTKHLNEFDYECNSCKYRTNLKHNLERHIKTNHLEEFDYKCHSCEFKTNQKYNLECHVKSQHLKEFSFNCDFCEFKTNRKHHLEQHIKTEHLKRFDFKCDSCEYKTNNKKHLEYHIKTKHLKDYNYKCCKCEFGTTYKRNLECHIKSKHLKEFNYKCDSCEFGTNSKYHFEEHIKTKHFGVFNFKCDKCVFQTNIKSYLENHIKTKHLKEFDYKCDFCEFRTNNKAYVKVHIKTKHLKELNYKCNTCEFRTNHKNSLERHVKTKHLDN